MSGRVSSPLVDDGPLCCCEYRNKDGETAHILSCCCDCSALDDAVDRCIRCAPAPAGSCDAIMATVVDRVRVPWLGSGGAVQLQCDVALPILVIPTLLVLATAHELLTIAVCLTSPAALLLYYCAWRRRGARRGRTRFFYAWSLVSTFACFYVFVVAAFSYREVLLWEMLIVYTLFAIMMYTLYLVKCDPGTLRPIHPASVAAPPPYGSAAAGAASEQRLSSSSRDAFSAAATSSTGTPAAFAAVDVSSCSTVSDAWPTAAAAAAAAAAGSGVVGSNSGLNHARRTRLTSESLTEGEVTWVDSRPLKDGVLKTYCDKCHLYQPRRANHCLVCQQCIEERDHHCVWLDQCIGRRNHRPFLAAMVLFVVNGLYASHLMLTTMCTPEMYYDWFLLPKDCRFVYSDFMSAVTFVSCCYSLTAIFFVFAVLVQQVILISQNVTLQEFNAAARRGWIRWIVVVMNNPNNQGFRQNWADFFSSRRRYHHHHHHHHRHHHHQRSGEYRAELDDRSGASGSDAVREHR